jgi:cytochrome c oxidase assembly factor CtaG
VLRAADAWLLAPWPAVALFNITIVVWHLPGPLDLAQANQDMHLWLMDAGFFAAGCCSGGRSSPRRRCGTG